MFDVTATVPTDGLRPRVLHLHSVSVRFNADPKPLFTSAQGIDDAAALRWRRLVGLARRLGADAGENRRALMDFQISGDELAVEIATGIAERADWKSFDQKPNWYGPESARSYSMF